MCWTHRHSLIAALIIVLIIVLIGGFSRTAPHAETFVPPRPTPCALRDWRTGPRTGTGYALWDNTRNQQGTTVRHPYSTQSKVSLFGGGEAPSLRPAYQPANPISGIGKTSNQRLWSDPLQRLAGSGTRHTCGWRQSIYEIPDGYPGSMGVIPADDETHSTDGSPFQGRYRFDPEAGLYYQGYGGIPPAPCATSATGAGTRENFTSTRRAPNTLTASSTGLGMTRRDPRFEPGPPSFAAEGDAIWAHGGHAGGPTFGAYTDSSFAPGNVWGSKPVRGFGDGIPISGVTPSGKLGGPRYLRGAALSAGIP